MPKLSTTALKSLWAISENRELFCQPMTFGEWRRLLKAGDGGSNPIIIDALLELERLELIELQLDLDGTRQISLGDHDLSKFRSVFVVHGHDTELRLEVERMLLHVSLIPVIVQDRASSGRHLMEQIEAHSDVQYALVLLSPDDVGYSVGNPEKARHRARQNVVLELGFFIGILGRNRVRSLYRGDLELPSDYRGVLFTPTDQVNRDWRNELCREMRDVGLPLDPAGLLS